MTSRFSALCVSLVLAAAGCGDDDDVTGNPDGSAVDAAESCGVDAAPPAPVILESRFAPAADTLGDGVSEFADMLETVSSLTVVVQTPSAGTNASRIMDRVNEGTVDVGIDLLVLESSGLDASLDAVLDLYGESIPFGLQTEEYLAWLQSSGGLELLHDILRAKGYDDDLVVVPVIAMPGQAAGMFKGAVDDARLSAGFLMRSFGFGQLVLEQAYPNMTFIGAQGGSVSNIAAGFGGTLSGPDCDEAGTDPCELQGAEFTFPCTDVNQLYSQGIADDGVTHYAITAWQSPATVSFLFFRRDNPNLAGAAAQIELAAQASLAESWQRLLTRQSECLAELRDNHGQTIAAFPDDVLLKLQAAAITVLTAQADANPDVAAVLAHMAAFARANQTWWNHGPVNRTVRFANWGADWASAIDIE